MHGVPKDLDLSKLIGRNLDQVAIGEFQIQFVFDRDFNISVEGHWELRDVNGELIDAAVDNSQRDEYRIHRLLGLEVSRWAIKPPKSITIGFLNGMKLEVFDSSSEYESFSIQPGDIYV